MAKTSGIVVICSYRPKPGNEQEVLELTDRHLHALRASRLITTYPHTAMQAEDGTVIEIFEWASVEAARKAETDTRIQEVWRKFAELADFVPLSSVQETTRPFAHFRRPEAKRRNRVVHFELLAMDPERCKNFYEKVFAWKITPFTGGGYMMVDSGEEPQIGIHGGIMRKLKPEHAGVCNTVQVDSIDEHCILVGQNGGKIVAPRAAIPGIGWFAYATDPEGTVFGMMQLDPTAK